MCARQRPQTRYSPPPTVEDTGAASSAPPARQHPRLPPRHPHRVPPPTATGVVSRRDTPSRRLPNIEFLLCEYSKFDPKQVLFMLTTTLIPEFLGREALDRARAVRHVALSAQALPFTDHVFAESDRESKDNLASRLSSIPCALSITGQNSFLEFSHLQASM
jgi:hypothetical protein